jgi:hypothetical protein
MRARQWTVCRPKRPLWLKQGILDAGDVVACACHLLELERLFKREQPVVGLHLGGQE